MSQINTSAASSGDRRLVHPGPVDPERIASSEGHARRVDVAFRQGQTLLEAVTEALGAAGLAAGCLEFSDVAFSPMEYVKPTYSDTPERVAYYSETHKPEGVVRIERAYATVGEREGETFLHCHALWRDADGTVCGGHLWPHMTRIAEPGSAVLYGVTGTRMAATYDPETNFTLFQPSAGDASAGETGPRAVIARVRPNEDMIEAIEALCARHGFRQAVVRSGIGSTVGVRFEDGLANDEPPTELAVLNGRVSTGADGKPRADVEIFLIDASGAVHTGKPVRGDNPILISLELVVEETAS
ncbi:PCC domain-containing protein [Rhodobium gokarnense]|uniref:DNA-binding protein with PD1-like motif n=1 Tax=Rhodobium gokarnense TaxID=364296 RepID=A0ABT3HFC9_9HYPH|nr:DUF296 domain-containing protein [Rhodobium gokarnense]MCW2309034.1 putative DNA-binding protein with PD1-like motif [Rhodobium gokarnense]